MEIMQFVTEALGDSSYLVISDGEAAVVDPQRDVRPYVSAAESRGVRIGEVFETHVHNDYVSGGAELAARGAEVVAPADAGLAFLHRPIADGDEVAVGRARIRAVRTPGHTHHHVAYLAIDEAGEVVAAFTGGSIIIGGAGLYQAALPLADRFHLTRVHADVEGDTFLAEFDESEWQEISREQFSHSETNPYDYSICLLERKLDSAAPS